MTESQEECTFTADAPIEGIEDDKLNRQGFAAGVCRSIEALPTGSSMTIGIHGPWGDGKTSLLNMMRTLLQDGGKTTVGFFNPWRFTDEDSMFDGFFRALGRCAEPQKSDSSPPVKLWSPNTWSIWPRRQKPLESAFEATCRTYKGAVRVAGTAHGSIKSASKMISQWASPDIEELRNRLMEIVDNVGQRIVLFIDDIDRLDKHEIQTLFRLVKACTDLPNVTYVLAFDETIVAESIGERYGSGDAESGRAFLEKVIQIPLYLPPPRKEGLRDLCFQHVDRSIVLNDYELTTEEVGDFTYAFQQAVEVALTTPRQAKKYGNAVAFALPLLIGEVNVTDVLLIQALRVFYPRVFDLVCRNQDAFTGTEERAFGSERKEPPAKSLLLPILDGMRSDKRKAVESLLTNLFPRMSGIFGNTSFGSDWLNKWDQGKRICSPGYCSRYFSYAVEYDDVADAVIEGLDSRLQDGSESEVSAILTTYLKDPTARSFIGRLRAAKERFGAPSCEKLALALAPMGATIPDRQAMFSSMKPTAQAGMLISDLISGIPAADRKHVAQRVLKAANPLWFASECLRWLYVTDDDDKKASNTLSKDEFDLLRGELSDRIEQAFREGYDFWSDESGRDLRPVDDWRRARDRDSVEEFLLGVFNEHPRRIAPFLRAVAPDVWTSESTTPVSGSISANTLENIDFIIDVKKLAPLVEEHCDGDFEDLGQRTDSNWPSGGTPAEQFIYCVRQRSENAETGTDDSGSESSDPETRDEP